MKIKQEFDTEELSEETKRNIAQAEKEIREGKTITLEEVKKKLNYPQ